MALQLPMSFCDGKLPLWACHLISLWKCNLAIVDHIWSFLHLELKSACLCTHSSELIKALHTHTHFLYHPLVFLFWRERGGGQGREVSLSFLENYLPWFKFPCNHCFYFRHNCWVICNKRRQIYSWLLKCIPLLMQGALNSFKILFFNLKLLFFKFEFFLFFFDGWIWVFNVEGFMECNWILHMSVILETLFN